MTQEEIGGSEQVFDIELFEKEYFESLENDPEHMAMEIEFHDWKYFVGLNAANIELISAKRKIRELMIEINKQEAIVDTSKRTIQAFKHLVQVEKTNRRGRPERSAHREEVVRKFTMKWVASLKNALEVKSCGAKGGLEYMVNSAVERNWRRWLNGDAIPSAATFENLLNSQITGGKYDGELLRNVPVNPTHNQMLTLFHLL